MNTKIILIMGLPGSGKTTLSKELLNHIDAEHFEADVIRQLENDWDFSEEGRMRQVYRMRELARDAYERGNMIFRDWEDTYKQALNETNYYRKETPKMSKNITEQQLRQIVRKVLREKLAKNEAEVVTETVEEEASTTATKEEISNDQWYQNNLFESLKRKWTK